MEIVCIKDDKREEERGNGLGGRQSIMCDTFRAVLVFITFLKLGLFSG